MTVDCFTSNGFEQNLVVAWNLPYGRVRFVSVHRLVDDPNFGTVILTNLFEFSNLGYRQTSFGSDLSRFLRSLD